MAKVTDALDQINKAVVDTLNATPSANKEYAEKAGKAVAEGMKALLDTAEKIDIEKVEQGMKSAKEFVDSIASSDKTKKIVEGLGQLSESLGQIGNLFNKPKGGGE